MYQKFLTLFIFAVCTYTDIRYRKIYGWSLVLYGILAMGGRILGRAAVNTGLMGTDAGLVLNAAAELASDLIIGLLPGLFCIAISWISRQSLGYGDSILIAVSGISLGLLTCLHLLLLSLIHI